MLGILITLIGPGGALITTLITRDLGPVKNEMSLLGLKIDTLTNSVGSLRLDMQSQLQSRDLTVEKLTIRLEEAEKRAQRNELILERLATKLGVSTR